MTDVVELYQLAHELGHCECGAFYNRYSPFDLVGKHERRADCWAKKTPPEGRVTCRYSGSSR